MAQRTPRASNRHSPQAMNTLVHIPDARHQLMGQQQQEAFSSGWGDQGHMLADAKCNEVSIKVEASDDILEQATKEDGQGDECGEREVLEEDGDLKEAKEDLKAVQDD